MLLTDIEVNALKFSQLFIWDSRISSVTTVVDIVSQFVACFTINDSQL